MDKKKTFEGGPGERLKSVLSGVSAGFIVGLFLDGLNVQIVSNPQDSNVGSGFISSGMLVGLVSGGFIGLNNLLGNRVYVMTEEQAENRLVQDYASGTSSGVKMRGGGREGKGDRTFVAREGERIVGCVDFVYRRRGSRGNLPAHVHCKNMLVDEGYRRRGIGRGLMENVKVWAKEKGGGGGAEGAECLTLEVDDDNEKAIRLYRKVGFGEPESIGTFKAKGKFGTFVIGRSFMICDLE